MSETTSGWLYNMILSVLNTQLRSLLEQKLTSTAVTKLQELAGMANDISKGFLTISMTEEVHRPHGPVDSTPPHAISP